MTSADGEALMQTPVACLSITVNRGDANRRGKGISPGHCPHPMLSCDAVLVVPAVPLGRS